MAWLNGNHLTLIYSILLLTYIETLAHYELFSFSIAEPGKDKRLRSKFLFISVSCTGFKSNDDDELGTWSIATGAKKRINRGSPSSPVTLILIRHRPNSGNNFKSAESTSENRHLVIIQLKHNNYFLSVNHFTMK